MTDCGRLACQEWYTSKRYTSECKPNSSAHNSKQLYQLPHSLSGYFGVFHRLLVRRLRDLNTLPGVDTQGLEQLTTDVVQSVCPSQHTYVHAQLLLQSLGARPWGGRFRRLSQDIEARAAAQQGGVVWRMHHCFVPHLERDSYVQAARYDGATKETHLRNRHLRFPGMLCTGITAWASHRAMSKLLACAAGHDVLLELETLYASNTPPPLDLLRHPKLLQQLIAAVFDPGKPLQQADVRRAILRLLSTAAAAVDERCAAFWHPFGFLVSLFLLVSLLPFPCSLRCNDVALGGVLLGVSSRRRPEGCCCGCIAGIVGTTGLC